MKHFDELLKFLCCCFTPCFQSQYKVLNSPNFMCFFNLEAFNSYIMLLWCKLFTTFIKLIIIVLHFFSSTHHKLSMVLIKPPLIFKFKVFFLILSFHFSPWNLSHWSLPCYWWWCAFVKNNFDYSCVIDLDPLLKL